MRATVGAPVGLAPSTAPARPAPPPVPVGADRSVRRDVTVALAWVVVSAVVAAVATGPVAARLGVPVTARQRSVLLVLVVLQAAALVLRRVRPVTCLALVAVLQLAITTALPDQTILRAGPTLVVAYALGTRLDRRLLVALVSAATLELLGQWASDTWATSERLARVLGPTAVGPTALPEAAWLVVQASNLVLVYATPALAGVLVSAHHHRARLLDDRAAAAWGEREARAELALGAERARMARELHDIAAHHLSGMVVQAAAAERLVDRDPEAARAAIATLRAEGREALSSLRSMVGVLRERGAAGDGLGAPVPGVAGLSALLDRSRAIGDDIELTTDGEVATPVPIADAAVYRVLQEALANARQHAPGATVRVLLRRAGPALLLRVDNDLTTRPPQQTGPGGFGLVGMSERAALAGGDVSAGPRPDGSWRVELTVPAAGASTTGTAR